MVQRAYKTIEGKVAQVLNDREVVINRGSEHGVELGMRFKIIEETEEVVDPDTQESIGSIVREKIRVKIVHVQPLLSVGRTFETYREIVASPYTGLFRWSSPNMTKVRTISSSETATDETNAAVRTGEKVIQVDEYEESPAQQIDSP